MIYGYRDTLNPLRITITIINFQFSVRTLDPPVHIHPAAFVHWVHCIRYLASSR